MPDEGVFATTAEVQRRVNTNASSTSNSEAYINQFIAQTESLINVESAFNWSDVYSTLNADLRDILKMAAVELSALKVEMFDPDLLGRATAGLSVNTHIYLYDICIKLLKDASRNVKFINNN